MGEMGQWLRTLEQRIASCETQITRKFKHDERCARLAEVPGVGPLTGTALVAAVGNAQRFKNGRELSAYLGLVPRQHSSGGKTLLLGITKRGDRYLRTLLIHGARSALKQCKDDTRSGWARRIRAERGPNVAAVALANKNARVLRALLTRGDRYSRSAFVLWKSGIPKRPSSPKLRGATWLAQCRTAHLYRQNRLKTDALIFPASGQGSGCELHSGRSRGPTLGGESWRDIR
jgi:hypothetical protein